MSRHGRNRNGVPDRWLDYRAVGKRLPGTRFVAFKVPLKQSLTRQLSRSDVFGPWELLDALNREKQELGLIIDLTFTSRYYMVQDVPESLLFVKIFTAGHQVPSDDTILSFKRAVRRFLRDNSDNDKLIGVHCTHGLNRTGYLICRYLIDVDGMDPKEAVQLFNLSRGHAIERENYLDDLQRGPKRSNDGMEDSEQEPMRGHAARRPSDAGRWEERRPYNESRHHSNDGMEDSEQEPMRGHAARRPSDAGRWEERRPYNESRHHSNDGMEDSEQEPMRGHAARRPSNVDRWEERRPHNESRHHRWLDYRAVGKRLPGTGSSRYPPAEWDWSPSSSWHRDRWRAPPPPPPHPPPPPLPRYSVRWTNESNGGRPERARHRYTHRADTYNHY